jgi:amino acid permease
MNKKHTQIINVILIVVGGAILIFTITGEERSKYLQILGLIIIMFGLYRATNFWVETKDDTFDEVEDKTEVDTLEETENEIEGKSNHQDKKQ